MPDTDTGERVTPVLDFPSRDVLATPSASTTSRAGSRAFTGTRPARTCT
jgi:hypothetical protein